ncbi:uncharacterized protein IL334_003234 [Kwoniella shivajii]|uniref:Spindle pole body component n=1 Tax=Kwoniella shivajii TaxID=564305 RepID=A0ABZ1CWZ8_9TREE|nr:hypothetical protein IL334_003234 [Kwoniella shivajii]
MTTLFPLAPLPLMGERTLSSKPNLPNVEPRFVLPPLDDHISGPERLMGSLRGTSRYDLQDLDIPLTPTKCAKDVGSVLPAGTIEEDGDIWRKAIEQPEAGPSRYKTFEPVRTWNYHQSASHGRTERTPFLSEKSTFTFDALITSLEPPIALPKLSKSAGTTPVNDSRMLLEIMMRSTLGTVTTERLKWSTKKAKYTWIEEGGRSAGVERKTSLSMMERFLDIGTSIRRLEIIVDSQSILPLTPTHHALLHALSTYLTFIKQRLTSAVEESLAESQAGWIKWIGATKDVRELGEILCEVMCWPLSTSEASSLPSRAPSLLSHLYFHLLASLSTSTSQQTPLSLALAFLFSKSIRPFLTLLHSWVGVSNSAVQDEDIDSNSQPWSDLGITRSSSPGSDTWQYSFSSKKMPSFIPKSDRKTLFEAGKNLRLLREASAGGHPLCSGEWGLKAELNWSDGSSDTSNEMKSHARRVQKKVDHWRNINRERARPLSGSASSPKLRLSLGRGKERKRIPIEFSSPPSLSLDLQEAHRAETITGETILESGVPELDILWSLFNESPGTHLNPTTRPDEASHLWAPTPLEELHSFLSLHSKQPLLPHDSPTLPIFVSTHLLSSLLSHSRLVSTSLVSLYLDDLRFLDHLDILHSYWLGGDVSFIERASSALFGKDSAGAGEALGLGRRARTRARLGLSNDNQGMGGELPEGEWGIGLGLGLSERSKWPPGGSELAYALRTTLLEQGNKVDKGPVWEGVEDRVSFAIKQLDEDDKGRRAKWLDPQAIEALDFLYLSYSPPPSISNLLPPSLLQKYQHIHNLLLRLSRCQVVLRSMYWNVLHQSEWIDEPRKSGVDSGHNKMTSRGTLQKSRERQIRTLFPTKSNIERRVQILRFRMSHVVKSFERYVVDGAIGNKWENLKKRLENLKIDKMSSGENDSRPSSPTSRQDEFFEIQDYDDEARLENNGDGNEGEEEDLMFLHQLQSPHSIILYHNLVLDKILSACLLGSSPGQQVTYKILMALLSLVLDLGKVLVEVERGAKGWQDGKEQIEELEKEWNEKEKVFLHALERLSLRTTKDKPRPEEVQEDGQGDQGEKTENDLHVLLNEEQDEHHLRKGQGDDLADLILRLKLGNGIEKREGRWKNQGI